MWNFKWKVGLISVTYDRADGVIFQSWDWVTWQWIKRSKINSLRFGLVWCTWYGQETLLHIFFVLTKNTRKYVELGNQKEIVLWSSVHNNKWNNKRPFFINSFSLSVMFLNIFTTNLEFLLEELCEAESCLMLFLFIERGKKGSLFVYSKLLMFVFVFK